MNMNDVAINLFSGGAITVVSGIVWIVYWTIAHQRQLKHLEDKIDYAMKHMDEKMNIQDKESKERISRLEKYFDIIMQTQIKKNSDKFSMEGGQG